MKGLLLMITLLWLGTAPAGAQNPVLEAFTQKSITNLQGITASYFKHLPFNKNFSTFLREIIADPDLQYKVEQRRTDSTFFYFSGTYSRHNPFIYRPSTIKLIIAEAEFRASDTSAHVDTVVYCQLVVTSDSSTRSEAFVQKEYNRLLRKCTPRFTYDTYGLGAVNSAQKGQVAHCFYAPFAVSPLTVAWGRNEATREYVFSISLRMKVQANRAGMVTLPYEPLSMHPESLFKAVQ